MNSLAHAVPPLRLRRGRGNGSPAGLSSNDIRILDVGCESGTITVSLAQLVPEGTSPGLTTSSRLGLERARARAEQGITNVTFAHGDACDAVHCHQVLQHLGDPVRALREMRRVAKKSGGIVAVQEADTATFAWFPETEYEGVDEGAPRQAGGGEAARRVGARGCVQAGES